MLYKNSIFKLIVKEQLLRVTNIFYLDNINHLKTCLNKYSYLTRFMYFINNKCPLLWINEKLNTLFCHFSINKLYFVILYEKQTNINRKNILQAIIHSVSHQTTSNAKFLTENLLYMFSLRLFYITL